MKCEHCGKNEVTFVYQSNINGNVTEKHLCSQCARELGYADHFVRHNRSMMSDFFGGSLFGRSMLEDFFSPRASLFGRMLEDPFDDFFADMPALQAAPSRAEPAKEDPKKEETLVNDAEQSRFARMRQLNALRHEMKRAVREENFERAAQLRDEIRKLEDTKESA